MRLEEVANVYQGAFISRVEQTNSNETIKLSVLTMKDINESVELEFGSESDEEHEVYVLKSKLKELPIAKQGSIVVNLTVHRAVAIQENQIGKLIPSNFAIIELQDSVDPDYFEWYLNEHPHCRKQVRIATQGSSVSALSIQMLRKLEINLPSLADQMHIGRAYRLVNRKHRLLNERMLLEKLLVRQLLLNTHEGDNQ